MMTFGSRRFVVAGSQRHTVLASVGLSSPVTVPRLSEPARGRECSPVAGRLASRRRVLQPLPTPGIEQLANSATTVATWSSWPTDLANLTKSTTVVSAVDTRINPVGVFIF